MKKEFVILGAVALAIVGVIYFLKTTTGKAVGTQAAGVVTGFVGGVGDAVVDVIGNPDINPLHGVGSWLGDTIFDWTHPDIETTTKYEPLPAVPTRYETLPAVL